MKVRMFVLAGMIACFCSPTTMAVVGVNDTCPLPTPYPPSGAGWAAMNNANMESGFTDGVANQWIGWQESTYTTQVHFAGNDRYYDGAYSQKLNLPQPPAGFDTKDAGIYQQIYVVAGQSYTVTAKLYLSFPPQTYNGEDLVAYLGVDPYGEPNGSGGGMKWSNEVSQQNQWVTASVTVDAVFPVMTVGIKGRRKWPQHGDGALVWIDQVTVSGPVPTSPPPGPDPAPIDPETLIPTTTGPNLIGNPSFEDTYANGVSAGWNAWSTAGSGTWKRSQRVGKVGGGRYDGGGEDELVTMKPKTILLLGHNPENFSGSYGVLGTSNYITQFPHMQDTIVVGRPMVDNNYGNYYSDPVYWGTRLANQCADLQQIFPRVDCWQGLNEPGTDTNWQQTVAFEHAFATRCHELGLKTCLFNLATGNPGNIWRMIETSFNPDGPDVMAIADYLGHHVYGGPTDHMMVTNQQYDDACCFALRPRRFKDMYDRRGWRFAPVIATEGSTWVVWHGVYTPDQIYNDLVTMGAYMNANDYWCGYTNFVVGASWSWPGFDICGQYLQGGASMAQAIGTWNADHPSDAKDGLYSQMFGAGYVHPINTQQLTPAGLFNGGVNRLVTGLTPDQDYLLICWLKYEFRGYQPDNLGFYLGIDPTGQTTNGNAATINWGVDQIADKAKVHEIFTHVWRTFTATSSSASVWLRASHPVSNPSFMVYVDKIELRMLAGGTSQPTIQLSLAQLTPSTQEGSSPANNTFTVANSGTGTLAYSISDNADWLSCAPASGTSTGEADTITVSYSTASLSAGTYNATITVSDPAASNSPQTIAVQLTVNAVPPCQNGNLVNGGFESGQSPWIIFGSTDGVVNSGYHNITAHGGSKMFGVGCSWQTRNGGAYQQIQVCQGATVQATAYIYTDNSGSAWDTSCRIGIDPYGGTNKDSANVVWTDWCNSDAHWSQIGLTGANSVTAQSTTITVFIEHWHKWALSYNLSLLDDVVVTITGGGGPQVPAITLSPTSLTPSTNAGSSPPAGSFTVQNSGQGTLAYTITDNVAWLSCTPTSGTSTGEADTITVNYSTASLSAGTYYATITVTDSQASNSPQTVAVTLTVNSTQKTTVAEDFNSMPSWSSSWNASWGSAATWSIVSGGQSGNALQAVRSSQGSSANVKVYTIDANTNYTISVYIKCPSYGGAYWAECAYKYGSQTAQNFDQDSGSWTMIKKFSDSGTNGNGNTWVQYTTTFNSGSNTQISVGYKLGSSGGGGPTVQWDTLRIE